jgi:hypothetical protein
LRAINVRDKSVVSNLKFATTTSVHHTRAHNNFKYRLSGQLDITG